MIAFTLKLHNSHN